MQSDTLAPKVGVADHHQFKEKKKERSKATWHGKDGKQGQDVAPHTRKRKKYKITDSPYSLGEVCRINAFL
jgi:hypothetical protein